MMIRALRSQHLLAILTVPALWAISGCGDDGLPSRYSVSGKVTYKGEPVQKGKISFVPEVESGRGATGAGTKNDLTKAHIWNQPLWVQPQPPATISRSAVDVKNRA